MLIYGVLSAIPGWRLSSHFMDDKPEGSGGLICFRASSGQKTLHQVWRVAVCLYVASKLSGTLRAALTL